MMMPHRQIEETTSSAGMPVLDLQLWVCGQCVKASTDSRPQRPREHDPQMPCRCMAGGHPRSIGRDGCGGNTAEHALVVVRPRPCVTGPAAGEVGERRGCHRGSGEAPVPRYDHGEQRGARAKTLLTARQTVSRSLVLRGSRCIDLGRACGLRRHQGSA